MASSGVVKVVCMAGAERWGGGGVGEIICEGGVSERKGEEGSHAGLPTPFYNYVECKLLTYMLRMMTTSRFSQIFLIT